MTEKRKLVVKGNALINASYNLELVEQRLILLAIIEARASGRGINPQDCLTITASSYMNNYGTSLNAAYMALKEACNNLFERQFTYSQINENNNKVLTRSRWVSEINYIDNEASVKLIFAPAVVPLITMLEQHFTSYDLEQVAGLSSKYAIRLFELVIAWRVQGYTPLMELRELRGRLGVLGSEYKEIKNFKSRVLDMAIGQINKKTDVNLSYEQHKKGRSVVGFSFLITQSKERALMSVGPKTKRRQASKKNMVLDDVDTNLLIQQGKALYDRLLAADLKIQARFIEDNPQLFTSSAEKYYRDRGLFEQAFVMIAFKFEQVSVLSGLNTAAVDN